MNAKTFVDTNVLIYAHDADAGTKHETARGVLRDLWGGRTGVLSTQVLQEFYVNVTRKIATPLPKPSPCSCGQLCGLVHRHHASRNFCRFPHRG